MATALSNKAAIGLALVVVGGLVVYEIAHTATPVRRRRRKLRDLPSATEEYSMRNPLRIAQVLDLGLAVDRHGVYISDLSKWFAETPAAFEEALVAGAVGPRNVLTHVLKRALPHLHWPPVPHSPHFEQFQDLVRIVAEEMPPFSPDPTYRHLKVVR